MLDKDNRMCHTWGNLAELISAVMTSWQGARHMSCGEQTGVGQTLAEDILVLYLKHK
jgi:hypothetical protein